MSSARSDNYSTYSTTSNSRFDFAPTPRFRGRRRRWGESYNFTSILPGSSSDGAGDTPSISTPHLESGIRESRDESTRTRGRERPWDVGDGLVVYEEGDIVDDLDWGGEGNQISDDPELGHREGDIPLQDFGEGSRDLPS